MSSAEHSQAKLEADDGTHARRAPRGRGAMVVLVLIMLGVGVRAHRFGTSGFPSISEIFTILAALLMIFHAILHPERSVIRIDSSLKLFAGFLLWSLASSTWAFRPEVVSDEVLAIGLKAVAYCLIISTTVTEGHLDAWGKLFIFMSIAFAGTAYYEGEIVGFQAAAAAEDQYHWINTLGKWTALLLPFNVHYLAMGRTRIIRGLAGAGIAANIFTVYLISRRAPLLVLTLELILFALLFRRYRKTIIAIALVLIMVLPLVVMANPVFAGRVAMTVVEVSARLRGEDIAFGSRRFMQYQAGIAAVKEHYLIGMGLGSLRFWTHEVYGYKKVFWPHNLTLQIIGELGIPGALLFAAFVLSVIHRAWLTIRGLKRKEGTARELSLMAAMLCSVIGLLVYAQFQPMLTDLMIYLGIGLLSAGAAVFRTPPRPEQKQPLPETED